MRLMFNKRSIGRAVGIFLAAIWGLTPALFAQARETDVGEVAGAGGVGLGVGQAVVKGSAGYMFSRHGMALFEASFMPMGTHTIQPWPDRASVDRSLLYEFGLDFHVHLPVSERVAPYGIIGGGLLWNMVRERRTGADGSNVLFNWDQVNGGLHTGGGVRYYAGKNWGIRPEVKVIVSKHVYTQITMGIFYVTPPNWP